MEFGVAIFSTHDAIRPGDVARLAEERGQESLFFPEHTHIPVSHSPYPGGEPPVSLQVIGVPADAKVLDAYAAAGFDRVVHWLPSAGRGTVERALDAWESAIAEFAGE